LASHLLNLVPPPTRPRFLQVCAQHLALGGTLLVELHDPAVFTEAPLERRGQDVVFRIDGVGLGRAGLPRRCRATWSAAGVDPANPRLGR
jgi:hypothetical protein